MPNDVWTDRFRPLSRIFDADSRQTCYSVIDEKGTRPKTIEDHYRVIERFVLNSAVPPDVAIQFDTAKELLVHAWCNLRFTQIAERHAYASVEMALRLRLKSDWTDQCCGGQEDRKENQSAANAGAAASIGY
jgi:hypothetical protein